MKSHLERAKANEHFLAFIDSNGGDEFLEWKMTVLFYASLHYLKAYLKFKKAPSGNSHKDIDSIINPSNPKAKYPLPQEIYNFYNTLYQNSWEARYTGVYHTALQAALLKWKCSESLQCLSELKLFFMKNGLNLS